MMCKEAAATKIIKWHFEVQPEISAVYLMKPDTCADTPIKLLEVNDATIESGIEAYTFGATDEIPYSTTIIEITSSELDRVERGTLQLPRGWILGTAKKYTRNKGLYDL